MRNLLIFLLISLCLRGQNAVGGKYSRGGSGSLGGGGAIPTTPTLIQNWCQGLGSTGGTTNPQTIVGANFVWITVGGDHSYTVVDSNGATPTALTNVHSGGPDLQNFYVKNSAGGASYTVTVTASGSFQSISVCYMAWSGVDTVSPLDSGTDQGTGVGAMSSCQVPNITPSSGVKLVLISNDNQDAAAASMISPTYAIPANGQLPYTTAGSTFIGMSMAWLIQTPNGAATQPTWTGTNLLNCSIAAFKGM